MYRKTFYLLILLFVIGFTGCKEDWKPSDELRIGQKYLGGTIVQLNSDKTEGIIVAKGNQAADINWNSAMSMAENMALEGSNEWYMPEESLLKEIFKRRDIIGGFEIGWFWSSTEKPNSPDSVACINFAVGRGETAYKNKSELHNLRIVRKFTVPE